MKKQLLKNLYAVFLAGFMALLLLPQAAQAQGKKAYVVKSSDKKTLTFYYDTKKSSRTGSNVWGIEEKKKGENFPAWSGTYSTPESEVSTAVFDASFKNYRPQSTEKWFFNFVNLKKIDGLTNLNTSEVTNMASMFWYCEKLSKLDLSNFDTRSVIDMSAMFDHCMTLEDLNLSSFKTSEVTNMASMFDYCITLKNINLSSFNTSKVTSMSSMFNGCSNLSELDLSHFDTKKVEFMTYMFYNCSSLTKLNLSSFNTANVTNMYCMFFHLKLTTLDLSNFDTKKVEEMKYMFQGCEDLQTIYCNDTWTCAESEGMFSGCEKLKGAVPYNENKVDVSMANPNTGYFTKKKISGVTTITNSDASIQAIYSTDGKRLNELQRGLNIVRMSNGTTQKILRK